MPPIVCTLKNSSPWYCSAGDIEWADCTRKSQLTTSHIRICQIPKVITYSAPAAIDVDFQSSRCEGGAGEYSPHKPQVTTSLCCGWNTMAWEQDQLQHTAHMYSTLHTAHSTLQYQHAMHRCMFLASSPRQFGNPYNLLTTCVIIPSNIMESIMAYGSHK